MRYIGTENLRRWRERRAAEESNLQDKGSSPTDFQDVVGLEFKEECSWANAVDLFQTQPTKNNHWVVK